MNGRPPSAIGSFSREQRRSDALSRRRFLSALLTAGAGAVCGRILSAQADASADLDKAVTLGMAFLAKQQGPNGAFNGGGGSTVFTTASALLAFLGAGNVPDLGKYGLTVRNAVDGLLAQQGSHGHFGSPDSGIRGHATATLALAQAYGVHPSVDRRITVHAALTQAAAVILASQLAGGAGAAGTGGWALDLNSAGGHLSVTASCLLALRACADIGLATPQTALRAALGFVLRCYDTQAGGFGPEPGRRADLRATAAGVVCLHALDGAGGDSDKLDAAAKFMIARAPEAIAGEGYGGLVPLAAQRLGGEVWMSVGRPMLARLAGAQQKDGSWPQVIVAGRPGLNPVGATASALHILTMSYALLPMYQR